LGAETIAAIATPPGRGAIAVVRLSGPDARAVGARVFRSRAPLADRQATFGRIVDANGATIDEGLALFFASPRSYTGEDVLELHVHGSTVVARDVLLACLAAGARHAEAGEFTRRAFLAGKLDLSQAEAVADLIEAEHRSAARAAAAQLAGGLAREAERLRGELERILEELAAAIDFPDEVETPPASALAARLEPVQRALAALLATAEAGRLVREGVSVAIVGPPNAGKSSLLNALLGAERALVSEIAGTTRDTIEETLALDGIVARVIDTAGLRRTGERLEAAGIARAERALDEARIALVVIDGSAPLTPEARDVLERTRGRTRLVFFNKADLGDAGYEMRDGAERDALLGSAFDPATIAALRRGLSLVALDGHALDVQRPHLANARQAGAIAQAERGVAFALETLSRGEPQDLIAGDLLSACAALAELSGRDAHEALLTRIFARFCIGK
jgi:tRNA modification GTPase